jgi:hypothetical protein
MMKADQVKQELERAREILTKVGSIVHDLQLRLLTFNDFNDDEIRQIMRVADSKQKWMRLQAFYSAKVDTLQAVLEG